MVAYHQSSQATWKAEIGRIMVPRQPDKKKRFAG
jgi:hypothetical protein